MQKLILIHGAVPGLPNAITNNKTTSEIHRKRFKMGDNNMNKCGICFITSPCCYVLVVSNYFKTFLDETAFRYHQGLQFPVMP